MDARARILARRSRFLVAALAACGPAASASSGARGQPAPTPASSGSASASASAATVDADHDGIPDAEDACPYQPGMAASWSPEKHGCPCLSIVSPSKIVIVQRVFFAPESALVRPASEPLLGEIALVLGEHPEISVLELVGFRDATESAAISSARAEAVRAWLVKRGVGPARLAAVDGGLAPAADDAAKRRYLAFVVR